MVAGDVMRAQADDDQVHRVERLFPKAARCGSADFRGVIDQDIKPAMLSADPREERGDRRVLGMVEGNGDPGSTCARDTLRRFANGAAKRGLGVREGSPGDVD